MLFHSVNKISLVVSTIQVGINRINYLRSITIKVGVCDPHKPDACMVEGTDNSLHL